VAFFEEVEKVSPDLVARGEHGKPYGVRYEEVNAMLLNEFLKRIARTSSRKRRSSSNRSKFRR